MPPSSPYEPASSTPDLVPVAEPFAWLRFLTVPMALAGLAFCDPAAWPLYVTVAIVLTLEWPCFIQLAEGVEIYLPVAWTAAAAAYVLGLAALPVVWISATLGFLLIGVLDRAGLVAAKGLAAESLKGWRGEEVVPGTNVAGLLRQFVYMTGHVIRVLVSTAVLAAVPQLPFVFVVVVAEAAVAAWLWVVPVRDPVASPRHTRARLAAFLGRDVQVATDILQVAMVCFLLLAFRSGGAAGFAVASVSTLVLHWILKRLNDSRIESERHRLDLLAMRDELDRRQRMAVIGHTASTVFHQIARHHGAIGIFAHLLARGPAGTDPSRWMTHVHDHAERILASLEEAKHVIDELLRFGQDRSLNLYPHSFAALVRECVGDCDARAERRQVALVLAPVPEATLLLDKHKVKQAVANLVDNAIDATPAGERVEIEATLDGPVARITVRDHGPGVPETIRPRLFTPFCTTKTDGIGLGLALARELAEAHGGSVAWRPASPGAIFVLTLPHHPASPAADEYEGALYSTSNRTRA